MRILRYVAPMEIVPWYLGFVRHVELGAEVAVIPLNLVLSWGLWLCHMLRYRLAAKDLRWEIKHRAIVRAFERGYDQGKVAGKIEESRRISDEIIGLMRKRES